MLLPRAAERQVTFTPAKSIDENLINHRIFEPRGLAIRRHHPVGEHRGTQVSGIAKPEALAVLGLQGAGFRCVPGNSVSDGGARGRSGNLADPPLNVAAEGYALDTLGPHGDTGGFGARK